jgi:hypothetical protein
MGFARVMIRLALWICIGLGKSEGQDQSGQREGLAPPLR